jgi:hypothetical protein
MAVRRTREIDDGAGANGLVLALVALLTIAMVAMIAWILIDNAHEEAPSRSAAVAHAIAPLLLGG